jgi:hypothetical protein
MDVMIPGLRQIGRSVLYVVRHFLRTYAFPRWIHLDGLPGYFLDALSLFLSGYGRWLVMLLEPPDDGSDGSCACGGRSSADSAE